MALLPPVRADETGKGPDPALVQEINAALDVPGLQTGFQGILIQSLAGHVTLYERNADQVFMPASNNKLLTSAAALELLGPAYVYRTRIYRTGPLGRDGILHGDLILRGAGDPLLSADELAELAQQIGRAHVRRLDGHIRYDDSFFDRQRLGASWEWDDEPFAYSPQISALNCNENVIHLQVTPGAAVGAPIRVVCIGLSGYLAIENHAITGAAQSKSTLTFDRLRGQNRVILSGSLPLDTPSSAPQTLTVTLEDPSRYAALVFQNALQRAGIRLRYKEPLDGSPVRPSDTLLTEHASLPLFALLPRLNKPSDNLIAECLLKTIGAEKRQQGTSGTDGTGSREAASLFLRLGLDTDRLQQADGSGLSRLDFVSPRNLVRLLDYLHTADYFPTFYDSLPIAGVDGTLRNRLKNTAAQNNCRAKTGTLSHASSLSGYVMTRDGDLLAFSILMNNHLAPANVCTAAQDRIVTLLANYTRRKTRQE